MQYEGCIKEGTEGPATPQRVRGGVTPVRDSAIIMSIIIIIIITIIILIIIII